MKAFDTPLDVGEREPFLQVSEGICTHRLLPTHGTEPMMLLKHSETALQPARLERRASLKRALRDAVAGNALGVAPSRKFGFHPSSFNSFGALDGSSAPSDFDDRLQYFVEQAPRLTLAVARRTDVQLHRSPVDQARDQLCCEQSRFLV